MRLNCDKGGVKCQVNAGKRVRFTQHDIDRAMAKNRNQKLL